MHDFPKWLWVLLAGIGGVGISVWVWYHIHQRGAKIPLSPQRAVTAPTASLEEALRQDPTDIIARINLMVRYARDQRPLLRKHTFEMIEHTPGEALLVTLNVAEFYRDPEYAHQVLERLEAALKTHPQLAGLHDNLARLYQQLGVPRPERDNPKWRAYMGLAEDLPLPSERNPDYIARAENHFSQALACVSAKGEDRFYEKFYRQHLAEFYVSIGALKKAIPLYEAILAETPHDENWGGGFPRELEQRYHRILGDLYSQVGDEVRAQAHYDASGETRGVDPRPGRWQAPEEGLEEGGGGP